MLRVAALAALVAAAAAKAQAPSESDVIVYGSTPGGIMSAVAAARHNVSVTLITYSARVGGMCSGGLGWTDKGDPTAVGGLALQFFKLVAKTYNASATEPLFALEPHVAEEVFLAMLGNAGVKLVAAQALQSVTAAAGVVTSLTTSDGQVFQAPPGSTGVFIDASYEGDLLAAAGIATTYGREPRSQYNESYAGRREPFTPKFDFRPISPFDDNGDPLPLITEVVAAPLGSGDDKVQGYCFRLCGTRNASNLIPWPKPANYNASQWTLLRRLANALGPSEGIGSLLTTNPLPHGKYDLNNGALVSTDFTGGSWAWPSADASTRQQLYQAHVDYQQGLLWTLANDEGVPARIRADVAAYGLCADEFTSNGGWPEQLYVREARRLIGDTVFTQADWQSQPNYHNLSIGMGSYPADGHYSHRGPCIPSADNKTCAMVTNASELAAARAAGAPVWTGGEGYPGATNGLQLYQIPYWVLLPRRADAVNVLAPLTPSATHVAFATLRMEPQFMILGHASGVAAALAVQGVSSRAAAGAGAGAGFVPVQDVDVGVLHATLAAEGAVLCHVGAPACL